MLRRIFMLWCLVAACVSWALPPGIKVDEKGVLTVNGIVMEVVHFAPKWKNASLQSKDLKDGKRTT
ncbi:MAG: hypothetical protein IJJ26_08730, partial [Victivallales bacterium]|nr:hypothetical protein [Victivallales bacterium]